jgi:hypothetical protein
MAKAITVVLGLVLTALGGWAVVAWWPEVLGVLKALLAVLVLLAGVGVLVFGLSELRTPPPPHHVPPAAPRTEEPGP